MTHKKKHRETLSWLEERAVIGARESVFFPDLGLHVQAKVDTGARTSSLHASNLATYEEKGQLWVCFDTYDSEARDEGLRHLRLPIEDRREIRSSNGELSQRYVVRLWMRLGPVHQKIEVTLAERSQMKYPMLLGRKALEEHFLVAPGARYLLSHA